MALRLHERVDRHRKLRLLDLRLLPAAGRKPIMDIAASRAIYVTVEAALESCRSGKVVEVL